jgi:hypothetical protein
MPGEEKKLQIRMPEALWAHLVDAARDNRRSLNQEMVWRLGQPVTGDEIRAALDEMKRNGGKRLAF